MEANPAPKATNKNCHIPPLLLSGASGISVKTCKGLAEMVSKLASTSGVATVSETYSFSTSLTSTLGSALNEISYSSSPGIHTPSSWQVWNLKAACNFTSVPVIFAF